MSFLKFIGKKGSEKGDDLDLPPLPPPQKGTTDLNHPPPMDNELDLPNIQPPMPGDDMGDHDMPSFPDMPYSDFPETPPAFPETPEMPPMEPPHEEEPPRATFRPREVEPQKGFFEPPRNEVPRKVEPKQFSDQPIFVKIDKYRNVIEEVNKIKSDFEKTKNILSSMAEIKVSEDKELENWKLGLEDIRKKLGFIDKNIFEG